MTDTPQQQQPDQSHRAVARRSRWPGWIWAVPAAAIVIVAWLGYQSLSQSGPEVTVVFPLIADLKVGNTEVKFEDLKVGEVSEVHVAKDLTHMRVKLRLKSDMENQIGPGTEFWIIGKNISLANLGSLKSIIAGVSVGIDPKPGKKQKQYTGLTHPPIPKFGTQGTKFTLHTDRLGALERGTPIFYLDDKVGQVRSVGMIDGNGFDIGVFIDRPYDKLVHPGSRFWKAGPVRLSTGGSGPALQFQSIGALFEGAIAFNNPQGAAAQPSSPPDADFTLYDGEDAADYAPDADAVAYRVVFTGTSNTLSTNAPVNLMGNRVGSVTGAKLVYDPDGGKLSIDATLVLEPSHINLANGEKWTDPRKQMDALLQNLVGQGLRAELSTSPPVIGGSLVDLRIVPGQHGTLGPGPMPEIPSSSGSNLEAIMAEAHDVVAKVNQIPIAQIGNEVHQTTQHLASIAASPEIPDVLHNADDTMQNVAHITHDAKEQVPPILAGLRHTVGAAEAALTSAEGVLSASGGQASNPETSGLPGTLYEVSRAARSLRELADFLDRHPESLLKGRGAQQ